MPRGKYTRKKRTMTMLEEGVAAEAAPESPPTESAFEQTVIGVLEKLSSRLEALENSGPKFVKATVEDYGAEHDRYEMAERAPADGIPRSQTVPVFSSGEKVPEFLLGQFAPRFGSGSRVRLNLSAVPHGRTDGKTRGELMDDAGVPDAIGEVFDRVFLSKAGVWKYRVRFPSKTLPGSNGGMTALHEPELIPA